MKRLLSLLTVFFLVFTHLTDVNASNNFIKNIQIDCHIDKQGTATFVEKWDMDLSEGTEGYKVFNGMGEQPVTLISVEDDKGTTFKNIGQWNSDISREGKMNKCGLIKKGDHYEICFGLGNYGERSYTMTYKIAHFVNQYKDKQGINYAFLSDMDLDVGQVTIHLSGMTSYDKSNSKIWAFGYEGDVNYDQGGVTLKTDHLDGNKMQLLMGFNNHSYTFPNMKYKNKSFQNVVDEAKKGSAYSQNHSLDTNVILGLFTSFALIMALIFFVVKKIGDSQKLSFENGRSISEKDVDIFRDIPCHKNLMTFYYFAKQQEIITEESRANLVSAFILKWVRDGLITIQSHKKEGLFKKDVYEMHLNQNVTIKDEQEAQLYQMFLQASHNSVLKTKTFEHWCEKHYDKIDEWFDQGERYTEEILEKEAYIKDITTYTHFLFWKIPHDRTVLTDKAYEQCLYIWGFYRFLKDEDNMKDKAAIEVKLWDEYLIFAAILGLADRVEKQLKVVIPRYEENTVYRNVPIYYYTHTFVGDSFHAAEAAASQGAGGFSSFGGGGTGFSGGGGGGVR